MAKQPGSLGNYQSRRTKKKSLAPLKANVKKWWVVILLPTSSGRRRKICNGFHVKTINKVITPIICDNLKLFHPLQLKMWATKRFQIIIVFFFLTSALGAEALKSFIIDCFFFSCQVKFPLGETNHCESMKSHLVWSCYLPDLWYPLKMWTFVKP